jgi:hypothetical protein
MLARLFNVSDRFPFMDESLLIITGACAALAFLVYLMWREATKDEWSDLSVSEKRKWRIEEEKRKEKN